MRASRVSAMAMRALLGLAVLGALLGARSAQAQDQRRADRAMVFAGLRGLYVGSSSLRIDGERRSNEGSVYGAGLEAGARYRVLGLLGVELRGHLDIYRTSWAADRQEGRTRADVTVGPVLTGEWRRQKPYIGWRVGLPVGPSWSWFEPGPSRGVEDDYGTGHGVIAHLIGGLDLFSGHQGGYLELAAMKSWFTIEHRARLKSDPAVFVREEYRYADFALAFTCGYAVRF